MQSARPHRHDGSPLRHDSRAAGTELGRRFGRKIHVVGDLGLQTPRRSRVRIPGLTPRSRHAMQPPDNVHSLRLPRQRLLAQGFLRAAPGPIQQRLTPHDALALHPKTRRGARPGTTARDAAAHRASAERPWDPGSLSRQQARTRGSRGHGFLARGGSSDTTAAVLRVDVAGEVDAQHVLQRAVLYGGIHGVVYASGRGSATGRIGH